MKSVLTVALLLVSSLAVAEPCFGPGSCQPTTEPTGPTELCLSEGCQPIRYSWLGDIAIAESILPNGYAALGWAGPCLSENRAECPDILNQAAADLRLNALRANRAQRYE